MFSAACGGTFNSTTGTVSSPGLSLTDYHHNINCTYHIVVSANTIVQLRSVGHDRAESDELHRSCVSTAVCETVVTFPPSTDSTPFTWRRPRPAAMTTWTCTTEGTPWRPCWAGSAVRCSRPACTRPPTSSSWSSRRTAQWAGSAGGPRTGRHSVRSCTLPS